MPALNAPHAFGAHSGQIDDLGRADRVRAPAWFGRAQPASALLQRASGGALAARLCGAQACDALRELAVAGDGQLDPVPFAALESVLDIGDQHFICHIHVTPRGSSRFCSAWLAGSLQDCAPVSPSRLR